MILLSYFIFTFVNALSHDFITCPIGSYPYAICPVAPETEFEISFNQNYTNNDFIAIDFNGGSACADTGISIFCKVEIERKTKKLTYSIISECEWHKADCDEPDVLCCNVLRDPEINQFEFDHVPKWCRIDFNDTVPRLSFELPEDDLYPYCPGEIQIVYIVVSICITVGSLVALYYYNYGFACFQKKEAPDVYSDSYSDQGLEMLSSYSTGQSRDYSYLPNNRIQTIPITRLHFGHEISYCYEENTEKAVDLGGGRYGRVYKAKYQEQFVAVKCIQHEHKAEHEKIMFDLIGSRSDHLLRLLAYVAKYQGISEHINNF